MTISTTIPESFKLPLFYATVDGSQAGGLSNDQPALIVGQMLAGARAVPNVAIPVGSLSMAQALFGPGSIIERQFAAWFANNTTQNAWALPINDPAASIAATGTITVTSGATASGVLSLYVADQRVQIAVYTTDALAGVAANLAAAINAVPTLTVTATANGAVVTLTSKNKGDLANDCPLTLNYGGLYAGEVLPQGLALTIVQLNGGQGEPDFSLPIANIQSNNFAHVCMPYSDTASLDDWDTEYGFNAGGRWAFDRAQYGIVYNSIRLDYSDALEWGLSHNSAVISTMIVEPGVQSPVYAVCAAYAANAAYYLLDDPARPLQTLPLTGILPAAPQNQFTKSEANTLTNHGFAIQGVGPGSVMAIVREAMQYQFNAYGQSDTAFGLVTTLATLSLLITSMKAAITTKFPRSKLAPDGTKIGPGNSTVTPSIIASEIISEAQTAIYNGYQIDLQDFVANLVVEIDPTNNTRLNVQWPPNLMPGLRQFIVDAQFRLNVPVATS